MFEVGKRKIYPFLGLEFILEFSQPNLGDSREVVSLSQVVVDDQQKSLLIFYFGSDDHRLPLRINNIADIELADEWRRNVDDFISRLVPSSGLITTAT